MKKRIFILTLILSLFLILTLTGCDKSSPVNFTINFDSQGGSYVPPIDFSNDKTTTFIPPANPVKEGYIFGGWYFDLNYEKEFIEQTFSIGEGSITLYAKWTILQNTITFNTTGGSSVDSITQPYDSAVSTPAAPTKDGYEFTNWYVNEECTTEFVFDKMPLASLVVYAGWQDVLKIMHTEKNIAFTQYNDENIYYYDNIEDIIYFSEYNFVHNPVSAIISDYDNFCAFNFASKDYAELFVAENRDKLIHENIKAVGTCVYAYMNDAYDCLNYEIVTIDNIMYVRTKVNSYSVFGFFERNSDDSIIEEITILGEIEGIPVTSISDYAFSNNNSFNITLPDSIETIGSYAFGYSRLKNIILSATSKLKTIESNAFYNAEITEFNIPTSLESIGENAFEYSSLETLNVPLNSNLKNIGQNAFNQTDWLYNQETGLLYIGKVLYTYIGSMPDIYEITLENDTLAIAPFAFEEMSNISSIILNEGLEIIGEKALRFTGISSLSIPASVQEIGLFAFGENAIEITVDEDNKFYKAVDNVLFNKSGTKLIGFYNMTLTSYTIPDTVDEICDYAFYGSALEEIIIPQSVTYIGDYAFKYSYNLTSISIPKAVTYLGTEAFYDCGNLTSVIIEDNSLMTHIGDSAFLSCYSLNSIDFGENSVLAYLGSYAFENSALTSIVIPESITEISEGTFNYCEYLTSVTLPDSIIGIGKDAFNSCINLSNINIPSSLKTIGEKAFYKTSISSLVLPSSLTSIDNYAFAECAQLSTVSFAQDGTLKEIPARLFYKCLLLTEVVLPQSLEIIGQYAFDGCSLLSEIIFPANLKFIDVAAFQSAGLTAVNIPAGIESISGYTFDYCEKLVTVNFEGTNIKVIGLSAFNHCDLLVNINSTNTLPNGLEKIDGYAFANCTSLEKIIIPSSVNSINDHAFMYTKLSDLTLPQNDITMGEYVFLECDSLISVNIPAEFTKIGDYAFYRCTNLSSITFEDNSQLSEIGIGTFAETALVNVVFSQGLKVIKSTAFNNIPTLTSVTFPNTLERIDSSAFGMCPLLDNLIFPDSLYAIGDSAFYLTKWMTDKAEGPVYAGKVFYSYKLNTVPNTTITSITINEGTIGIAGGSFMNLRGVTELTVPASVKYIDLYSIMSCGITTLNIERSLLVDGSITAAYNHFISGCSVYVPADSYEAYITAPVWKNYAPPYTYFKINGFKVDFNTLGGSAIKSQYIENGGKAVEPNEIISKEGYHLIGWYTAAEGGELFDFETAITANITLYAKYEADTQNCTVTFDTMGGTSLDPAIKGYSGMLAIPAQPKRLGFTFDGWYLDNALTQEAEFPMMITSNITLYAKWLPNDGSYNSPKKLTFGEITVGINNTLYYYFVSETDVVLSIVSNRLVRQDPYIYIYLEDGSYYNDIYKNNYFMFDGKINLLAGELYLISIENWDGELTATY